MHHPFLIPVSLLWIGLCVGLIIRPDIAVQRHRGESVMPGSPQWIEWEKRYRGDGYLGIVVLALILAFEYLQRSRRRDGLPGSGRSFEVELPV